MPFDTPTRNQLYHLVTDCRELLTEEFDSQLQELYGIYAEEGRVIDLERLPYRDDAQLRIATLLRERIDHLIAGETGMSLGEAVKRVLREQAFTVLNRFAALRMAEERGFLVEAVGGGLSSRSFKTYSDLAESGLGSAYERYRVFLGCLFDEMAVDLGVLFDRQSPFGLLFPRENVLLELFELLNAPAIKPLWKEDETIGWVYQYFNDPAERKRMREESAAPRNSRELAVRNQFFTPRYVVEFLTDNTLGRIWYEMSGGVTSLTEKCRYLVRRPNEIFLGSCWPDINRIPPGSWVERVAQGQLDNLPENPTDEEVNALAFLIDGYSEGERLGWADVFQECGKILTAHFERGDTLPEDLLIIWLCLFSCVRGRVQSYFPRHHEPAVIANLYAEWRRLALKSREAELSQDELLRQPQLVPERPKKDPRTILMIDPACGSMHFGLYAFDLFEVIYQEAWDLQEKGGGSEFSRAPGMKSLRETYETKATLLKDVPRLIIEHNLHGIDIDPRCAQIAGLSLWLRAQRAWKEMGVKPNERPSIKRSNIVCAEPMPGKKELLKEFVEQEFPAKQRGVYLALLETTFDKMRLAGEAGSLLKIEEEIRTSISEAKRNWEIRREEFFDPAELMNLSRRPGTQRELQVLNNWSSTLQLTDDTFWEHLEESIYIALRDYAEGAENCGEYKRRLFAEDAAHGFAFIDICRKRYDVVLMNPPFGESSSASKEYIENRYAKSCVDLFAAFVERAAADCATSGFIGVISTEAGFFRRTLESWRKGVLLGQSTVNVMAHFGGHVLDGATVRTAGYILRTPQTGNPSLFLRLLGQEGREARLVEAIHEIQKGATESGIIYQTAQGEFEKLPYAVFGYWCSPQLRNAFVELPKVAERSHVRQGLATGDDFRFLRLRWEISPKAVGLGKSWVFFAKGGEYSPYHDDVHLLVRWEAEGAQIKAAICSRYPYLDGQWQWVVKNSDYYFRPGLTYPRRTNKRFAPRIMPAACSFGDKGPAIVDIDGSIWALVALLNSRPVSYLIGLALGASEAEGGAGANSYEVGLVQRLPLPPTALSDGVLESSGKRAWTSRLSGDVRDEVTAIFTSPFACLASGQSLGDVAKAISERNVYFAEEYSNCLRTIDHRVCELFKFSETDCAEIEEQAGDVHVPLIATGNDASFRASVAFDLIQYSVGSTVGRWDLRNATGERPNPELPNAFAPLPVCPPGQLQNEHGLPVTKDEVKRAKDEGKWNYPIEIPWDGILVDDPNHPLDIEGRVREVIEIIWKDRAEFIEHEACEILGAKSLREYFRKPAGFFANHLKRYSKSRRQAPIYWPLSTPSGSYTLWIYYHLLTDQTLFQCVNEFVKPKLVDVESDLSRIAGTGLEKPGARGEFERLTNLRTELIEFRDELLRVAQLPYKPNLNDGVVITASPLWRLFRLPKWQRDLKVCWTALEKGEYDWAHLAYSIWPDRVKEACKKDRSIAIAHGMEELCQVKTPEKKLKKSKKKADRQLEIEGTETTSE